MRKFIAGAAALGMSLGAGACGSEGPNPVEQGMEIYVDEYGCAIDEIQAESINMEEHFLDSEIYSQVAEGSVGVAYTDSEGVFYDNSQPYEDLLNAGIHEAVHYCSDMSEVNLFDEHYEVEPGLFIVGSRGFSPWFNDSTMEIPNDFPLIEEGVAEWIASGFDNYRPSGEPGYIALHRLTETLANMNGLSRDEVAQWNSQSDFETFVAHVHGLENNDQLTNQHMVNMVFIYQEVFMTASVPNEEQLEAFGFAWSEQ